ncbi:MAG TPA: siderophore-iron reductase FhuF [Gammaproteobacteria bacterium]|nr:siderophore-iron reductase FhuF [Gammaproteobacteria bacterium]
MIASLAPLFTGPFAGLEDRLLSAEAAPPDTVTAAELFTTAGLDAVLARGAALYPAGDRRALLSLWSRYYFGAVIYLPVAANLVLGRALPLALDDLGVVLAETGEVTQLVLAHDGEPVRQRRAPERFAALLDDNLAPAIAAMAPHVRLSPRVLWSNAGHYFHYLSEALASMPGLPEDVHQLAGFMRQRHLPDGRRNPLFEPVREVADAEGLPHMLRRLCCIQFRLEGLGYCDNCPLIIRAGAAGAT